MAAIEARIPGSQNARPRQRHRRPRSFHSNRARGGIERIQTRAGRPGGTVPFLRRGVVRASPIYRGNRHVKALAVEGHAKLNSALNRTSADPVRPRVRGRRPGPDRWRTLRCRSSRPTNRIQFARRPRRRAEQRRRRNRCHSPAPGLSGQVSRPTMHPTFQASPATICQLHAIRPDLRSSARTELLRSFAGPV